MEYIPKYKQPFTYKQALELESPIIGEEITRLENSIFHLNRTQDTLRESINEEDEDAQMLLNVIRENEEVIASQKERITMLKLVLEERGFNTKSAHYITPYNRRDSDPERREQSEETTPLDENGRTQITDEDGGVYL